MNIISNTIKFVKKELDGVGAGHDWFHIERVWKNAKTIASKEDNVNMEVVELAALLHDVGDSKFTNGDETIGPKKINAYLTEQEVNIHTKEKVLDIIEHMSFRKSFGQERKKTLEEQIVQDADRLDAIGAIGIIRAFEYGGKKGRTSYNPEIPPINVQSTEQYKNIAGPTVNHFYEKLFTLKDKINTQTAKNIAEERHVFMEQFLEQFYAEWDGKK